MNSDHALFTSPQQVRELCEPIFSYLNIGYFHFRRTFKNGSYLILATDYNWPKYFLDREIPVVTPIIEESAHLTSYFCVWQDHIPKKTLSDAKKYFGIHHAITFVEKNQAYFDSYSFASNKENRNIFDSYLNNIDALWKFIVYFKEKSHDLIEKAKDKIITPPTHLIDLNLNKLIISTDNDTKRIKFLQSIALNQCRIKTKLGEVLLTKRESECLQYLSQGRTFKEIGTFLGISHRTVEAFLEKAKQKLFCHTTSELINIWLTYAASLTTWKN